MTDFNLNSYLGIINILFVILLIVWKIFEYYKTNNKINTNTKHTIKTKETTEDIFNLVENVLNQMKTITTDINFIKSITQMNSNKIDESIEVDLENNIIIPQ